MKLGIVASPSTVESSVQPAGDKRVYLHLRAGAPAPVDFFRMLAAEGVEAVLLAESSHRPCGDRSGMGGAAIDLVRDQIALFDVHVDEPPVTGVRFTDMTEPFDPDLRTRARAMLSAEGLTVGETCVAGIRRPDLLTEAEWRALAALGADCAVEHLPREARRARSMGLRVLGLVTGGAGSGAGLNLERLRRIGAALGSMGA